MALTLHGYVNTMKMCAMNVDAMNCAGVYDSGDLDNGIIVTLGSMNQNSSNVAEGFEYAVELASATTTGDVWIVASPEVGSTIDQQILSDPRYFYNEQGRTLSLKYLVDGVDCIEVTAQCFSNATLPTATNNVVSVTANGQLLAQSGAVSGAGKPYFSLEALHTIPIGMEQVPTAILRYHRATA